MNRNPTSAHRHRKRGKNIIMWGLILSVVAFLALGLRECPSLDPRENMARAANVPIEMWIELRDQHDVPLRDHPVTVSLWHWHNDSQEDAELRNTDEDGRLHVVGRRHCGVSLTLDKHIYQETHMMPWWFTSTLVTGVRRETIRDDWGTAEQPTICRVLRKEGPQPLTEVWGKVGVPHDARPLYLDLKNGTVTHQREMGDIEILVDLGGVTKEAKPPVNIDPDTGYVPGAVTYPEKTMWVRAVDGWIEEIPRDFNWYAKYVHAALPYKPVDAVRPYNNRAHDFGFIDEQTMCFKSRNGDVHGKFCLSVWTTYGPSPDVIIWFRGVVNAMGSASFEHAADSIRPIQLQVAPGVIPTGYTVRSVAAKAAPWDEVFRVYALARSPEHP